MAYTTQALIEAKLGTSLTSGQQTYFDDVLDAAIDEYIDRMTNTQFGNVSPTDIYVSGEDEELLIVPTLHTITTVTSLNDDGTDNETITGYVAVPRGSADVYALRKTTGTWSDGLENYKINAIIGYTDIPDDIQVVATELAINDIMANTSGAKSEKVGDWSITFGDNGKQQLSVSSMTILNNYRRLTKDI